MSFQANFQANAAKGKKVAVPVESSDGEDDATHQSGLEYDEQLSIEESDDTGSEFQASEEDESQSDMAQDSDQEAVMLSVAVERSLQPSRQANASANGAGSSRLAPAPARSPVAPTRKKAWKGRRQGRRPRNYVPHSPDEMSDGDRETPSLSSDEEPISRTKGKKKKAKAKKSVTKVQDANKANADWEDSLGEQIRRTIQERRRIKQEELALRRKLGRKLTTVSILSISPCAKLTLPSRPKKLQSHCIHNIPN